MDKKPMYRKIMEDISNDIQAGIYKPGSQIPTQKEICAKYGVSRIVVSTALKNLALEGAIVCEKGKGSFVRDQSFSYLKREKTKGTILFVIPNVKSNYCVMLVNHVMNEVEKAGYVCLLYLTDNVISKEEKITDMIVSSYFGGENLKCDGLILFSCGKDIYNINATDLLRKGIPTVLVDRNLPGLPFQCVKTNNRKAIRMATSYLIEQGHTKIALCCSTHGVVTSLSERIDGFMQEIAERNIPIELSLIVNNLNEEKQQEKLAEIFKTNRATAFIALNASTYSHVMNILDRCSLKCPEDISCVVFDKVGVFDYKSALEPTHILQDTELIAKEAVKHLLAIIDGKEQEEVANYLIDPIMVEGASVKKFNACTVKNG